MFVKMLVGREAGRVLSLPRSAAENCLASGTHVMATEAEVLAAGFNPEGPGDTEMPPELPPLGYVITPAGDAEGYDLLAPDGTRLNELPFRSLAAARGAAQEDARKAAEPVAPPPQGGARPSGDGQDGRVPDGDLNRMPLKELRTIAERVALDGEKPPKTAPELVEYLSTVRERQKAQDEADRAEAERLAAEGQA